MSVGQNVDPGAQLPMPGSVQGPAVPGPMMQMPGMAVDPAVAMAVESARCRLMFAYQLAYSKPRDEAVSRQRILLECQRVEFAEQVEYRRPQGRKQDEATGEWVDNIVTGPSIRLAELAIREWGNIWVETSVVQDDAETRRVKLWVVDLERGVSLSREVVITKETERRPSRATEHRELLRSRENVAHEIVGVYRSTPEEVRQSEARLVSMALRNEGLRLIPAEVIDEARRLAVVTMGTEDAKDLDSASREVLRHFAKIGVTADDIRGYLGHSISGVLTPKELADLRGIYQSINEGALSWVQVIGATKAGEDVGQVQARTAEKTGELKERLSSARGGRRGGGDQVKGQ